jgi:hypothetical protein
VRVLTAVIVVEFKTRRWQIPQRYIPASAFDLLVNSSSSSSSSSKSSTEPCQNTISTFGPKNLPILCNSSGLYLQCLLRTLHPLRQLLTALPHTHAASALLWMKSLIFAPLKLLRCGTIAAGAVSICRRCCTGTVSVCVMLQPCC